MQELSWKTICGYFPKRNRNSHKGTFGTLLCITGSNRPHWQRYAAEQA